MVLLAILPIVSLVSIGLLLTAVFGTRLHVFGAAFVVWYLWVSVGGRLLSAAGLLGDRSWWIALELVPVLVTFFYRAKVDGHVVSRIYGFLTQPARLLEICRSVWTVPVVLLGTIVLYSVGLVANFSLGQSMDDSLTAYLARAGFAISSGSLERFVTSDYNFALVAYPAMPTFSTVRWIVLTGNDHLATLDQWMGALIASTLVYSLARKLLIRPRVAFVISQLWLTMPVIVLQSQMVLNDLVTVVCLLTAVIFAIEWFVDRENAALNIAIVSILAALGTKQTMLFMIPSILFVCAIASIRFGVRQILVGVRKSLFRPYSSVSIACALFAATPEYIWNFRDFGHPLGPRESFGYFTDASVGLIDRLSSVGSSTLKVVYASAFSDVPHSWAARLQSVYSHVRSVYPSAGDAVDRMFGVGWFGLFPILIVLTGLVFGARVMRRRHQLQLFIMLAIAPLLFVLLFCFVRPNFSVAFSRYMIYPSTFLLILGGVVIDEVMRSRQRRWRVTSQVLLGVAAVVTLCQGSWSLAGNGTRPLVGADAAWGKKDDELLFYANGFLDIGASQPIIVDLNRCLSRTATVLVAVPFKFPLASLFGPNYTRHVRFLTIPEGTILTKKALASLAADAVIVDDVYKERLKTDARGLYTVSSGQFTLIRTSSTKAGCG